MADQSFAPPVYQTFDIKTDQTTVAPRLKALRAAMAEAGLDGFLVPRTDAHRGELVPAERGAAGLHHQLHRLGRHRRDRAEEGRRCSSIAATHCRRRPQTDTRACHGDRDRAGRAVAAHRRLRAAGRQARLRPLAAYPRRNRRPQRRSSPARRRWCQAPTSSTRSGPIAPLPPNAPDRVPRPQPRRQARQRQARRCCARRWPPTMPTPWC